MKDFLLIVVLVEHMLKFLKIFLESWIADVPSDVEKGEKERIDLEDNYMKLVEGPKDNNKSITFDD